MLTPKNNRPAKKPVKRPKPEKQPVKQEQDAPVIPEIGKAPTALVAPLDPQAFQYAMRVIDSAPTTGAEAGNIIMLKRELGRVANIQQSQQPG